jgi:ABC-2 type transport system ATP-binding protein
MSRAVSVQGLQKAYDGVKAVREVSFEIEVGEVFGLLGPNGAGKTTTVEILEGYRARDAGRVEVLGVDPATAGADWRERIGVVLQSGSLYAQLNVVEILSLFGGYYERSRDVDEVIAIVGLEAKRGQRVHTLSGGQKRRLDLGLALVGDPELVFLDEPTTGFDPEARRRAWDTIRSLRDLGKTILLTTHYLDEAERLCDRVAVIDHGKVIALGAPAELISRLGGEHIVEFALDDEADPTEPSSFADLATVLSARAEADGFALTVAEPHLAIPALLSRLEARRLPLARLTTRQVSLEDVFVSLTGRHLRDDETT